MARKRTDDDFRVACGFFGHPKTKKLRRRAGDAGVIDLLKLWAWATQNRCDGNLAGLADDDIEDAIDRTDGEPGSFVALLVDLRWIDGPPGARVLHEWFEHNPYAATKGTRVAKAKRAAEARWGSQEELALDAPDEEAPAEPFTSLNSPDATSIESDAPSTPIDAPSNAQSVGEQCPPHHTTPHHTPESVARAHEASPEAKSQVRALALALQRAGCPDASEHHPALVQVVVEGISVAALSALAREKPGKGVKYLIATLAGRMADTLTMSGFPSQRVHTSAGQGSSPPREPESQDVARAKARAHWQRLGFDDDVAGTLAVARQPALEQGSSP